MYSTSTDYQTYIENNSRTYTWYGTITLKSGSTIDLDSSNIAQGGITVKKSLFDGDMPTVGATCSTELDISIITSVDRFALYGASIEMYFRLYLADDAYEDVPIGIYYVNEAERSGNSRIDLVCYDAMTKLEKSAYVNTSGTPYSIISLACDECGVTLNDTEPTIAALVNGDVDLTSYVGDNSIGT